MRDRGGGMSRFLKWLGVAMITLLFVGLVAWRVQEALSRRDLAAVRTETAGPIPVQVATVERRDISGVIELSGTLRPANEVDLAPDVAGRIVSVSVAVGARVKKGEELAKIDATDLELALAQAEGALTAAQAGRDAAVQEAESADKLAKSDAITENQLVDKRSRRTASEGQLKQAQASRDLAKERVNDAEIVSPIAGVLTKVNVDIGKVVSPGVPVFQIQDDSGYEVEIGLDEATAYAIHPGQAVEVQSLARPDRTVPGTIATVAPTLDPQTRKAAAIVRLDPTTDPLLTYSTVTVRIAQHPRYGVVAIPVAALIEHNGESAVRLVVDGKTVKIVPVRIGQRQGDLLEVYGVEPGNQIVIAGPTDLAEGAQVEPRS